MTGKKVTFALRFVKFVAFLLFKDSTGDSQMKTAIIHHEESSLPDFLIVS